MVIYNSEDYGQGTNSGVTEKANKMWKTDLCGVLPISLWFEGDFACFGSIRIGHNTMLHIVSIIQVFMVFGVGQ